MKITPAFKTKGHYDSFIISLQKVKNPSFIF